MATFKQKEQKRKMLMRDMHCRMIGYPDRIELTSDKGSCTIYGAENIYNRTIDALMRLKAGRIVYDRFDTSYHLVLL